MKKILGIILIGIAVILVLRITGDREEVEPLPRNELQNEALYEGELDGVEDARYLADTDNSLLTWKGKTVVKSHTGTLLLESGELQTINGNLTGSFTIDMNSLATPDGEGVTNDLKSENFFDVDIYPTAEFEIANYSQGELQGDLTIKGITQPVSLPVSLSLGENTMRITGDVLVDRTLWGIEYRSDSVFSDLGDKAIDDNLEINIDILLKANNGTGE